MLSDRLMPLYFIYAKVTVFLSDFRVASAVRDGLDGDERLEVLTGKGVERCAGSLRFSDYLWC